jgi:hypothetical protein
MFKNLKLNTNNPMHIALIVLVLYVVLSMFMRHCRKSGYALSPATLDISTPPSKQISDGLFGLDYSLDCVPGPQATASPYTIGLKPGGICGVQKYVNDQAGGYKILGSNGGASLSQ